MSCIAILKNLTVMNTFWLKLSVSILIIIGLSGTVQAQSEDNLGVVFKIQVGASAKPIAQSNKLYLDFPELEEIYFDDGYYRYYAGTFEGYHAALEYLDTEVKPKGYKDAYVVGLQGKKRMTADEAIMLIYGE